METFWYVAGTATSATFFSDFAFFNLGKSSRFGSIFSTKDFSLGFSEHLIFKIQIKGFPFFCRIIRLANILLFVYLNRPISRERKLMLNLGNIWSPKRQNMFGIWGLVTGSNLNWHIAEQDQVVVLYRKVRETYWTS